MKPAMAARKVFILDDAEKMTTDSPDALLKTLEEPPAHTVMILVLANTRTRTVPATVLSRCQIVRFRPRADATAAASVTAAFELLTEIHNGGADTMFRRLERVDRPKAEALIDGVWRLGRDLLLAGAGVPPAMLTAPALADDIVREASAWTADDLLAVIGLCREAREGLMRNITPRLTMEILLSRLALRAV